jgi:hypothetical protein
MKSRMRLPAVLRLRLVVLAGLLPAALMTGALVRSALSVVEARPATAKQASPPVAGSRAQVRLEALGTYRNGVTGHPRLQDDHALAVGETAVSLLRAGDALKPSNVCSVKWTDSPVEVDHVFVWRVEMTVVNVSADRTTLQVHWVRSRNTHGQPVVERDETRTITLGPADSHVLDFVENQEDPSSSCASLLVRISAQPVIPQIVRHVAAEVWMVDETSAGQTRSTHKSIQGVTGQALTFKVQPLDFVPPEGGGGGQQPVAVDVKGTLQVALADDGLVDAIVNAVRGASSGSASVRGQGRVEFRAAVGETAALILPRPVGMLGGAASAPDAADAGAPAGTSGINLDQMFSGHRLWLYVRVASVR